MSDISLAKTINVYAPTKLHRQQVGNLVFAYAQEAKDHGKKTFTLTVELES